MFATVAVLRDPWEAHLLRGRLEAEDIPAFVVHEHYIAVCWTLSFALGGVKVQVPASRREDAEAIENLCRSGAYKELLREEFGEIDDPHCPYCGCSSFQRRRPYPRAAFAILISGIAGSILPPKGWIYGCKACGARYRHQLHAVPWTRWPLILVAATTLLGGTAIALRLIFDTQFGLVAIALALMASAGWTARTVLERAPRPADEPEEK